MQNFDQVKTAAIFDALIERCPNAERLLGAIKNIEAYINTEDERFIYAKELENAASEAAEAYRDEMCPEFCQASYEHERMEAEMV